jgi:two-component system, NarL family, nitrate/nitrite response regulator NarL
MTPEPLRVMIADRHPLLRTGVCVTLTNDTRFEIVGEACCASDAQRQCGTSKPDVLLLDLRMPVASALRTLRYVRECCPNLKIVALSAEETPSFIRPLVHAGIDGYIHKTDVTDVLKEAVLTVANGGRFFSRNVLDTLLTAAPANPSQLAFAELSPREREIVGCIARGWNNSRIERELGITSQTVRNYVSRIYEKLDVGTRGRLIVWARKHGIGCD